MKKLSLLFVFVFVLVAVLAFSASAKNITKEAGFSMANGGDLCQKDYVIDDNYFTAASNGNAKDYVDYYFRYSTGRTISRIRVIYNSVGENMGVCTYEEISKYANEIICRVGIQDGKTQYELKIKDANVVTDAQGRAVYSYIDFVPEEGKPWENIVWINVPTIHNRDAKTCIWEIDIFDDQECTADTHEWQNGICGTAKVCNACNAVSEELSTTEHFWRPASCAGPKQCCICGATEGEAVGEHIPATDDNDCSTPVCCTVCNSILVAAKKHKPDENGACTNEGCTRVGELNIANKAALSSSPAGWWATVISAVCDGKYDTSTHSPKSKGFSYDFTYEYQRLFSKIIVTANGECYAPSSGQHIKADNDNAWAMNQIKTVSVALYDDIGILIYETETYSFTDGATRVEIALPYTYYANKVSVKFNGDSDGGWAMVREIEIYETTVEYLDPEYVVKECPQEGCFDRVNFKDEIEEKLYYDQVVREDKTVLEYFYVVDEDGNYILDENGNVIKYAGAPVGGNAWANPQGCELDGLVDTGYCMTWELQYNNIQYNFKEKLLFAEITIGYKTSGNVADGYKLYIGDVVDGEEVWTLVVDFEVGEGHTWGEYLLNTFILGEDEKGVEGTMFRFEWIPGKAIRNNPSLCEVDMLTFKNTCTWTENEVLVEGNCGYDRKAECTCSVCGVEKTVVTALATCEHDLKVTKEATKATCVDFGYNTTKYCATCQKTFGGDRIEKPLGHDMSVAATCTTAKSCSRCDHTEGNPLGHKQATAATCTQKATCSVCNEEYGDFAAHTLVDLKCTACNKYVVVTRDELLSAIEKCSATEKETIVLGADIESEYIGRNEKYIILTKPITIDFAGKTLKLGVYQNGINMKHPDSALISSVGTGTFEYIGNTTAIKIWNADKIENININVTRTASNNPITGINIQEGSSNHINYIKNVRIEGIGLSVGFETYKCGSSVNNVIDLMENVYINATYKGASGKADTIGMKLQAPCGTFKNCEVNCLETGMIFRASANWSMTGTFVNCQVTGGTHGLNMYSDGNISSTAVLAFKSDANTTFTCTSDPEKSFTAALNGAIDNIEVEISGVKMVAYINGQFYGSFEEAYAVVPDGGTLQILADVELVDSLVINKKITLDLNKYTVSAPNGKAGDGVFHVVAGGELTIKGNGTVNGICANAEGYHMAIFVNGGNVVIEGGTFTNVGENLTDDQYDLIYVKGGELVINGGTFIAQTPKWTLNLHDKTPGSIVVNGGKFYNYDPSASESEKPVANFVADNKCAVLNDKDYYDVINHVKGGEWLYDAETDKMVKTCVNCSKVVETTAVVAKINSIGYASLEAAVAVGGEITLEANIDLATAVVINNIVTINLNGKTLTVKKDTVGDGVFCVVAGGELTINGEGIVNGVGNNNYNIAIWANGGSVVINGGTYTNVGATDENGDDHFDLIYAKKGGSVVINGGTFIAQTPKWTLNLKDGDGSTIVVNGGSFYMYNPTESASESPVVDFTNGKCAVKNSENYYVVVGEHQYFNACDARCEACDKITKEPTHNIIHVVAKTSTCTEMGNIEYWYCDICGAAWLDEALTLNTNLRAVNLPMAEHEYLTECDKICIVCNQSTRPEADHTIAHVAAKAPTCTAMGNIEYWYCEACGMAWLDAELIRNTNLKAVVLPMAEHEYFTPCEPYCMNCGGLTNPEATHTIVHVAAKAPTCTEMGNIEYWYCEACGLAWLDAELIRNTNLKAVVLPMADHTNTEIIPAVLPLPSNNHTGKTEGLYCLDCETTIVEQKVITVKELTDTDEFRFRSASLTLDENISINYSVPAGKYKQLYTVFIVVGKESEPVFKYTHDTEKDRYVFNFNGLNPQLMAENIVAYVYAETEDGFVMNKKLEYSIMEYCISQLKKASSTPAYKTLISNILELGAATQKYTGYKTDALVTDLVRAQGYTLTPTTFTGVSSEYEIANPVTGDTTSGTTWKSGSLVLGAATQIKLKFITDNTEGLVVKVNVAGKNYYFNPEELEMEGDRYVVIISTLTSVQYGEVVTATFERNGVQVGSTLTYSVNAYIYNKHDTANNLNERALLKVLYEYGTYVKSYYGY